MSLQEKIKNYIQTMQIEDNFSSLGNEIIDDFKQSIKELSTEQITHDQEKENSLVLWETFSSLPEQLFFNHSQELFEMILDHVPQSVYKTYYDSEIDLSIKTNIEIEPKSLDEVILLMLNSYLKKVSAKEVFLYLRAMLEKKRKNVQLKLLHIELLCWIMVNITKKEVFLPDLLPSLLHLLHYGFEKYSKYKKRVDNNEYEEVPEKIEVYISHYQTWIKKLTYKLIKSIEADFDNMKTKKIIPPFILTNDLYDGEGSYIKESSLEKEKVIAHYYILFILDLINLLLDQGNSGLDKELLERSVKLLLHLHNSIQKYISNYISQIKIKTIDDSIRPYNNRSTHNLLIGPYHVLSFYNTISISYMMIQFMKTFSESSVLSIEYKIQLLLPCVNELFTVSQQFNLKEEILLILNNLLEALIALQKTPNMVENLNQFNFPLGKVIEKILDYSGGPVDEKHRTLGIDIFSKVKKLLSEKALARLLLIIITTTTNYALSGHLVTEFKAGIINALKLSGGGAEIKNTVSSFLNINHLKVFFDLGINQNSPKFKDDNDLIGSCVNTLMLIYLKYSNLVKNVEGYMNLEFKDHCNLFKPGNLRMLLHYGEKAIDLQKMINGSLEIMAKQLEEMKQEKSLNLNLEMTGMRFNSLIVIYESITRIQEIYNELKGLINL